MRLFMLGLLGLCLWSGLSAQECLPDPGPPLFFEDFGSGPNPGPVLDMGMTGFTYGSIEEGHYVVSNTTGLNLAHWHDGLDNTQGDSSGYMLIFNATDNPTVLYQRTFTDLCPNTDYIAIYHVANVSLPGACIGFAERPNVRISALDPFNEAVQYTEATGEIWYSSQLTWWEYSLRFRTDEDQTSVLLRLANEAPGGCGNDLAIDDISLHLCNPQVEQVFDLCDLPGGSITIDSTTYTQPGTYFDIVPVPESCNDTLVSTVLTGTERRLPPIRFTACEGDTLVVEGQIYTSSITLVDTLMGSDPDCPLFQPTEIIIDTSYTIVQDVALCLDDSVRVGNNWYRDTGTYVDSLLTTIGCDSVVITNVLTGAITVGVTSSAFDLDFGESVQLTSTVDLSTDFSLSWEPQEAFSCNNCPDPIFQPTFSGTYQLIGTDLATGCSDATTFEVSVGNCENIYVPNAFSPNFDGVNDRLAVFAQPCFTRLVSWHVFDRWGGIVYEAKEQPLDGNFVGWDGQARGQAAERGIYTYQLILERSDGTFTTVQGDVMLIP